MSQEIVYVDRILDRDTGELLDLSPGALCKQCASVGYTCCQPAYGVSLTFHDAARICQAKGLTLADFCVINSIEDDELVEGLRMDPHFRKLFLGKRRLLQHIQHDLDCHFLSEGGCTIFEHRPRLCHFHPFWFKGDGKGGSTFFYDSIQDREDADAADCLVVNKLWPNLPLGLRSVGETQDTFSFHAQAMEDEIDWHSRQVKKLLTQVRPREITLFHLEPIVAEALERLEV